MPRARKSGDPRKASTVRPSESSTGVLAHPGGSSSAQPGDVGGLDLVQLGRDRDAVVVLDQRRPAPVDLEQPIARRSFGRLHEARAVEVRVSRLVAHERPVDQEGGH